MTLWRDLMLPSEEYRSLSHFVDIKRETVLLNVEGGYVLNGGRIENEYSISYDNRNWSAWEHLPELEFFPIKNQSGEPFYFKVKVKLFMDDPDRSPVLTSIKITFRSSHQIDNIGNLTCNPKLWITKTGGKGGIKLYNSRTLEPLIIKEMQNNEQIFIDSEYEDLVTSLPLTYRYDDHNDVFTKLKLGENFLYSEGSFRLDVRYQMKTL